MIRETTTGIELDVRVIPRAGKAGMSVREGAALVRLPAAPVDGAANDALRRFLSKAFDVPLRAVQILQGERSRHKRVAITGATTAQALTLLGPESTSSDVPKASRH